MGLDGGDLFDSSTEVTPPHSTGWTSPRSCGSVTGVDVVNHVRGPNQEMKP
jgi:hypothetical protein